LVEELKKSIGVEQEKNQDPDTGIKKEETSFDKHLTYKEVSKIMKDKPISMDSLRVIETVYKTEGQEFVETPRHIFAVEGNKDVQGKETVWLLNRGDMSMTRVDLGDLQKSDTDIAKALHDKFQFETGPDLKIRPLELGDFENSIADANAKIYQGMGDVNGWGTAELNVIEKVTHNAKNPAPEANITDAQELFALAARVDEMGANEIAINLKESSKNDAKSNTIVEKAKGLANLIKSKWQEVKEKFSPDKEGQIDGERAMA